MTVLELAEFTDCSKFELIVFGAPQDADEPEVEQDILFAVPIPPPFGDGLQWSKDPDGSIQLGNNNIIAWMNAWEAYIDHLTSPRRNRTRKQAEAGGAMVCLPDRLALPTIKQYQYAITTVGTKTAHLQPATEPITNNPQFMNMDPETIDYVRLYDNSPQAVSDIDLPTLRVLYSIILHDATKTMEEMEKSPAKIEKLLKDPQYIGHSVKVYIPDFLRMIGHKPNGSKADEEYAVQKIMSYSKILGVEESKNGRQPNHHAVMVLLSHNSEENTVTFSSPYLNTLILRIMKASFKLDNKGQLKLKRNGEPFTEATYSYLIKSSIAKEKNKRAVEIVCIVVTLIEQAGNTTPHIKARTLVDRCPDLKNALADPNASTANKNQALKRTFSKAWKLLATQTYLSESYTNIKFPTTTPTMGTIDKITFEFPHNGKKVKKS